MSVIVATPTVVKSGPATRPFGVGILASRPFAGRMPYTAQDLADAAAMFAAADEDRQIDALAAQREWEACYEAGLLTPVEFGRCLNCGQPCDELTEQGLCDRCDDLAIDSSTASRNYAAGLGFKVF